MSWKSPIPTRSLLLLSFLLVLSGPALEGCQSASVGDTSGAKPPEAAEEHESNRIYKNAGKLSDKGHGHFHEYEDVHDVGDGDHRDRPEEDYEYDHEAFLGDEAHEFDDLDPEESKRRLSAVVDKIDKDGNGLVTQEELRDWIIFIHDRFMSKDVEQYWSEMNKEGKVSIEWDEYRSVIYGIMEDIYNEDDEDLPSADKEAYRKLEERDKQRWNISDVDGDGFLSKYEFKHFLHPENFDKTKHLVVQETIDDVDQDGDGKISLEEYIKDIYSSFKQPVEDNEPEWVARERNTFATVLDHNKDGFLDFDEVKFWILPGDADHVNRETQHLIAESDINNDEMLSKDEIMANHEMFVSSSATGFGTFLMKPEHDEL